MSGATAPVKASPEFFLANSRQDQDPFSKVQHPMADDHYCYQTCDDTFIRCYRGSLWQAYDVYLASRTEEVLALLAELLGQQAREISREGEDCCCDILVGAQQYLVAHFISKLGRGREELLVTQEGGSVRLQPVRRLLLNDEASAPESSSNSMILSVFPFEKPHSVKFWVSMDRTGRGSTKMYTGERCPETFVLPKGDLEWETFYALPAEATDMLLFNFYSSDEGQSILLESGAGAAPDSSFRLTGQFRAELSLQSGYFGSIFGLPLHWSALNISCVLLTRMMHAAGTLDPKSKVASVSLAWTRPDTTASYASIAGILVEYDEIQQNSIAPPKKLVVKIGGGVGPVEIAVALYFRPHLPVATPVCVFGDFSEHSAILISEEIQFELPYMEKCMDHTLGEEECVARYKVALDSMAKLALVDIEQHFHLIANSRHRELVRQTMLQRDHHHLHFCPVNPHDLPPDEYEIGLKVTKYLIDEVAPHLFDAYRPELSDDQLEPVTMRLWCNLKQLDDQLLNASHYFAFSHNNLNLDNCYFWKSDTADLQVGFFDWNTARVENIAWSLMYSFLSAMPFIQHREDELIHFYLDRLQEHGFGRDLDFERLKELYDVSIAYLWLTYAQFGKQLIRAVGRRNWATISADNWKEDPQVNTWVTFSLHALQFCAANWKRIEKVASQFADE